MRVELHPLNSPAQLDQIAADQIDAGFVYLFEPLDDSWEVIPVSENHVVLAVPRHWELAQENTVRMASLQNRPFITFPRSVYPAYYDRLIAGCAHAGLTLNVVQEAATETGILALVSSGIGAAIVNSANMSRPPAQTRFIEIDDLRVSLPLFFAYKRDCKAPALIRFINTLQSTLPDIET